MSFPFLLNMGTAAIISNLSKDVFQTAYMQLGRVTSSASRNCMSDSGHKIVNHTSARYRSRSTYECGLKMRQKLNASHWKQACALYSMWTRSPTCNSSWFRSKQTISSVPTTSRRFFSVNTANEAGAVNDYLDAQNATILSTLSKDMTVIPNFLSEEEEQSLLEEVERYMRRLRYEYDHWDNAIHGFRETEKKSWNEANQLILDRVKSLAFHPGVSPLAFVHVLDISKDGYIKPHVDAVRFCGDTITGMCLLSSCVMRLALEKEPSKYGDVYLPQRCLYIMRGKARYDFTHEVLKESESKFKGQIIPRDRRISVICRNEPNPEDTK